MHVDFKQKDIVDSSGFTYGAQYARYYDKGFPCINSSSQPWDSIIITNILQMSKGLVTCEGHSWEVSSRAKIETQAVWFQSLSQRRCPFENEYVRKQTSRKAENS